MSHTCLVSGDGTAQELIPLLSESCQKTYAPSRRFIFMVYKAFLEPRHVISDSSVSAPQLPEEVNAKVTESDVTFRKTDVIVNRLFSLISSATAPHRHSVEI